MSNQTVLVKATLRVYGGFLLTKAQIKSFLDAPGQNRRSQLPLSFTPANDIVAYLASKGCMSYMYPCILKPLETPVRENPSLTLIFFTTRTVRYADVCLTDAGVVPRDISPASEEAKASVRWWLGLDPADSNSDTEAHVENLAARIFYMGEEEETNYGGGIGQFSSDMIASLFAHIAEITGKKPRELEFSIVYNEDDMRGIKHFEAEAMKAFQAEQASKLEQSSGTASGQSA